MSARNSDRLYRLVGEPGVDDDHEHGGGVEVVTLFTMILEAALDDGGVTLEGMTPAVQDHYAYKTRRLTTLYHNAEPFSGLTRDGIEQLVEVGLLREAGPGRWEIGEKFEAGKMLKAVRAQGRRSVSVLIHPREIRELRTELDTARLTTNECEKLLRVGSPGLRPVDHEHVARLARSMELEGYLAHHPVLVDKPPKKGDPYRWIIDGRHRLAAAKIANKKVIYREVEVESAAEVVSLARAANLAVGWSRSDWQRLLSHMSGPERDQKIREWVKWELEQDLGKGARRSDGVIAKAVGCSRPTVLRVRDALESTCSELNTSPTVIGSDGRVTKPNPHHAKSERVESELEEQAEPEGEPNETEELVESVPSQSTVVAEPEPEEQDEPEETTLDGQPAERQPTPKTCAIVLANVNDPEYLSERLRDILQMHATVPLQPLMKAVAAKLDHLADQTTRVG